MRFGGQERARLNCIRYLLDQIAYGEVPQAQISLPDRVFNPNDERQVLQLELYVPQRY